MPYINKSVLMSDAQNFSNNQPINPYYRHESVDCDKANAELTNLKNILIDAGINVTTVPSPNHCQDGVYTANWALIRGDNAVLANLPNARQAEEDYAEKVLTNLGKKLTHLPEGLKFSGQGDALACGDYLFCGCNYRSDAEAQKFAAKALGYKLVQLRTIPLTDSDGNPVTNHVSGWPDSYFYDIDIALAVIKGPTNTEKGLIAYCPEAFTPESVEKIMAIDSVDKIEVSFDEAKNGFATNLISTGETVIMSANAPKLAEKLRNFGLKIITPEVSELAKGGGYIRCVTLTLD